MKKIFLICLCVIGLQFSANARTIITYTTPSSIVYHPIPMVYYSDGYTFSLGVGNTYRYYRNFPYYSYHYPKHHHKHIRHHKIHHGGKYHKRH